MLFKYFFLVLLSQFLETLGINPTIERNGGGWSTHGIKIDFQSGKSFISYEVKENSLPITGLSDIEQFGEKLVFRKGSTLTVSVSSKTFFSDCDWVIELKNVRDYYHPYCNKTEQSWHLDQYGDFNITMRYGGSNVYFDFNLQITVADAISVSMSPSINDASCPHQLVLKGTQVQFSINENTFSNSTLKFSINNTLLWISEIKRSFMYRFDAAGESHVKLYGANSKWYVKMHVVDYFNDYVSVFPATNNYSTNKDITVSLFNNNETCVRYDRDNVKWRVEVANKLVESYNGTQFQHRFPKIGPYSKSFTFILYYPDKERWRKILQLYDSIEGFNISTPYQNSSCEVYVNLYIAHGSSVSFYYRYNGKEYSLSKGIIKNGTNYLYKVSILSKSNLGGYEILAKNPLPSQAKKKITVVDIPISIGLEEIYVATNETTEIIPTLTGLCSKFLYHWSVDSKGLSGLNYHNGTTSKSAVLPYNFTAEKQYDLTINVKNRASWKAKSNSVAVHARNRIRFTLPDEIVLDEGEYHILKPTFISRSVKSFQYQWIKTGRVNSISPRNTSLSLDDIFYNVTSENANLTLSIQNEVLNMTQTVRVRARRRIHVSIETGSTYCRSLPFGLFFTCIIHDNAPATTYKMWVEYGHHNTTDLKLHNEMNRSLTSHFSEEIGVFNLYCFVLEVNGTQTNDVFTVASVNGTRANISGTSFQVGQTLSGIVLNPAPRVIYNWYVNDTFNRRVEMIPGGVVLLPYLLRVPGRFIVRVAVNDSMVDGCHQMWSISVRPFINLTISPSIYVKKGNLVEMNVTIPADVLSESVVVYKWYVNNKFIQDNNKSNLRFNFTDTGAQQIDVIVDTNGIESKTNQTVYCENELTSVDLKVYYGVNKMVLLANGSDHIPSNIDEIRFSIRTNVSYYFLEMKCHYTNTSEVFFKTETILTAMQKDLVVNLTDRSGRKLSGTIMCSTIVSNNISRLERWYVFYAAANSSTPQITFLDPSTPFLNTNNSVPVKIRVLGNSLDSNVSWIYNELTLKSCDVQIRARHVQTLECSIYLSNGNSKLEVLVESFGNRTVRAVVFSVVDFTIAPTVIQVGRRREIVVQSVTGSNLLYLWQYNETNSSNMSYLLRENKTGVYQIRVTVYNAISTRTALVNVSVVDVRQYAIVSYAPKFSLNNINITEGENVTLAISNVTRNTEYFWNISSRKGVEEVTVIDQTSGSIRFSEDSGVQRRVYVLNVTARLDTVWYGPKYFNVTVFQKIHSVKMDLPYATLQSGKEYRFNTTWKGPFGKCYIRIISEGSSINVSLSYQRYTNHCEVTFKTVESKNFSEPLTYNVNVTVVNPASFVESTWDLPVVYGEIKVISLSEFKVGNTFEFRVPNPNPNATYSWYMYKTDQNDTLKYEMGQGAKINTTFTANMSVGNYRLVVKQDVPGQQPIETVREVKIFPENVTEKFEITEYPSGSTLTKNKTITLRVADPFEKTNYTWYLGNKTIGNGPSIEYSIPASIRAGGHTLRVDAIGPLVGVKSYSYVLTFCAFWNVKFMYDELVSSIITRQHTMSQWFYSEMLLESDCSVYYKWKFNRCKDANCVNQTLYNLSHPPNRVPLLNKPTLALPPRAFSAGVYRVIVEMKIGSKLHPFIVENNFTVIVVRTPLVPAISGGLYRVVGSKQQVELDAGKTIDPDVSYLQTPKLQFKWHVESSVGFHQCFQNKNNSFTIDEWSSENKIIRKSCSQSGDVYLTLSVRRENENKSVETLQEIHVIEGEAPLIEIKCVTCDAYKSFRYIPSKQFKLYVTCSNCGQLPTTYAWSITGKRDGKRQVIDPSLILSPLSSAVYSLQENALSGDQAYEVNVVAKIRGLENKGITKLILEENKGPENGSCSIFPLSGEAMVTEFIIDCFNWTDDDNERQPFIYWLVMFTGDYENERTVLTRGIHQRFTTTLPVGNEKQNWSLLLEIWVQDSLEARTTALNRTLILKPPSIDPVTFIEESVLPSLKINSEKKDLNQVTSAVVGASLLLSNGPHNSSYTKILPSLIGSTAALDATSVENIEQILNAFAMLSSHVSSKDIQKTSRDEVLVSLNKMMSLSESFTFEGISLKDKVYDNFVSVLGSNIKSQQDEQTSGTHRKRRSVSSDVDDKDYTNYQLIQQVYRLVLNITIPGESPKVLSGSYITANLQRRKGNLDRSLARSVGKCTVSYDIDQVRAFEEVVEISECSSLNPFGPVYDQQDIVALSLQYKNLTDILVKNLLSHDIRVGIPASIESVEHLNLSQTIAPEDIIWTAVVNLTEPETCWNYGSIHNVADTNETVNLTEPETCWFYSSIHIVVDTNETEALVNIHVTKLPNTEVLAINDHSMLLKTFQSDENDETKRTATILGRNFYDALMDNSTFYFGVDHDSKSNVTVNVTLYISTCRFWNVSSDQWEGTGCYPSESTRDLVVCSCNHLTSFGSSIELSPNELDFRALKKLNIGENPIALVTCLVVLFVYIVLAVTAYCKDRKQSSHVIPIIGSDDGFYQYEVRIKTGAYPWAGSSANIAVQIFGTSCTTKVRVLKDENAFKRNSLDIFRIAVDRSIGKVHKIRVWHDNSGSDPSWYLERVVIRSLVNGEKFFFFCNRWIGTDCEDGNLEHNFHVADTEKMQKFSTIFYDVLGRSFSDYHLWISLLERPKFSKFTRVQRLTCLFTFIFTWMAVNAMWFEVAPEGKVDIYIGFQGFSYNEIIIGLMSALIVFPLNLFFLVLFRKSRQKEVPKKLLKVWKEPRRVLMDFVHLDEEPLIGKREEGFQIGDTSVLQRGKKHLDIHKLLEQAIADDDSDNSQMFSPGADRLVQRTMMLAKSGVTPSSTSNFHTLTLPHSFDSSTKSYDNPIIVSDYSRQEPTSLKMAPQHQFRNSSISFANRDDFTDNLVKETVKRTQSANPASHVFSTEENRLLKNRLSTDELRSHMTDIVEQQLSSLVYSTSNIYDDSEYVAFLSDYTNSKEEFQFMKQIKRNEALAAELQIPDIVELDSCTRWSLPYWCTHIGFICCFLVSVFCIIMVLVYGQQFGREKALKWLQALIFGCLQDFFLTYPFILVFIAGFLALVVKPLDLDRVDHYDFMSCPSGVSQPLNSENVSPPTGSALESAKRDGQVRKQARKYAKDMILQFLLLWLVVSICRINFMNPHPSLNRFVELNNGLEISQDKTRSITMGKYWSWLQEEFIPVLYEAESDATSYGVENDGEWQFASTSYIQQVRVINHQCLVEKYPTLFGKQRCLGDRYETRNFRNSWNEKRNTTSRDHVVTPWTNTKQKQSHQIVVGKLDRYTSDGYYVWFPSNMTYRDKTINDLSDLKKNLWVDSNTRLLKHTAVLYNKNINMYAYYNLLVERLESGYMSTLYTVSYFQADFYLRNVDRFSISCVVLLFVVMVVLTVRIMRRWNKHGLLSSLKRFWSVHLIATVLITLLSIAVHLATLIQMARFEDDIHNGSVVIGSNIDQIETLNNLSRYTFSVSLFLVHVRLVRLVSWSRIYRICSQVMAYSTGALLSVALFHVLVVIAFSHFGMLIFQEHVADFRNFREAFLSTLLYRWWSPSSMVEERPRFGMFWNILYTMYWYFIMVNLFRAVMMNGRRLVKDVSQRNLFVKLANIQFRQHKKKQRRYVHFDLKEKNDRVPDPGVEVKDSTMTFNEEKQSHDERIKTPEKRPSKISPSLQPIPALPYSIFELNSSLITALAGLDQMISNDVWEEEMFRQFEKFYKT